MLKNHKGICVNCKKEKWIVNSKGQCEECRYKQNHNGKTKLEVFIQKKALKTNNSSIKDKQQIETSKKRVKNSFMRQSQKSKMKRIEILKKDREVYFEVFKSKPCKCEECGCNLPDVFEDDNGNIVAIYQYSHILSKGAFEEFRHNKINFSKLCRIHHDQWEFGDREIMNIYKSNQETIKFLKNE